MKRLPWNVILGACMAALLASCSDSTFSGSTGVARATPTPAAQPTAAPVVASASGSQASVNPLGTTGSSTATTVSTAATAVPPTAVTKGSFTVWANPSNPKLQEAYQLYIQIRLPTGSNLSSYQLSDLTGTLTGTDGYVQDIRTGQPSDTNDPFGGGGSDSGYSSPTSTVQGTTVTVVEYVPGAYEEKTQDTIKVTSALANESQSLTIVFQ